LLKCPVEFSTIQQFNSLGNTLIVLFLNFLITFFFKYFESDKSRKNINKHTTYMVLILIFFKLKCCRCWCSL